MGFRDILALNGSFFWGGSVGRGGAIKLFSFSDFLRLCQFWLKSITKCDRGSAGRWTYWQTDRRKPIL